MDYIDEMYNKKNPFCDAKAESASVLHTFKRDVQ